VVFPIALWVFALVCDVASLAAADGGVWRRLALYSIVGGLIGALAAAVPGLVDLLSLRAPRVRRIGVIHMILNLVAVALFAVNAWLRWGSEDVSRGAIALTAVGVALIGVSGWLGGEMVYVHGVGVGPAAPGIEAQTAGADRARRAATGAARTR